MAIIQNGFCTNTMAATSTLTPPATVWLYDTVTGKNVISNPNPPPAQLEFRNLSEFPVQNGNYS